MSEFQEFELVPADKVQDIKGLPFPAGLKYRQLIVTGPPGCGKTRLMGKIHGWPEEGYIDLTLKNWWRAQSLTFRPRYLEPTLPSASSVSRNMRAPEVASPAAPAAPYPSEFRSHRSHHPHVPRLQEEQ